MVFSSPPVRCDDCVFLVPVSHPLAGRLRRHASWRNLSLFLRTGILWTSWLLLFPRLSPLPLLLWSPCPFPWWSRLCGASPVSGLTQRSPGRSLGPGGCQESAATRPPPSMLLMPSPNPRSASVHSHPGGCSSVGLALRSCKILPFSPLMMLLRPFVTFIHIGDLRA